MRHFGSLSTRGDRFEDGRLRLIERRASLKDLRFATEPPATGALEVQSLHDSEGRIIGWFSWAPERGLARVMKALWVLVAMAGAALAAGAFVAAGAGLRLDRLLARSTETVRKLTDEDAVTALPSRRAMLKRLEGALASRRSGTVVLALIDPHAFREFKETLGPAGGDTAHKQVAEHLQAAVPAGALLGRLTTSSPSSRPAIKRRERPWPRCCGGALPPDPDRPTVAAHRDHRSCAGA
jgi:hypothetical protein